MRDPTVSPDIAAIRRNTKMNATFYDRRTFLATGLSAAVGLALRPALRESPQDLASLTASQASELLRRNAVASVGLTQAYLSRIEKYTPP